MRCYLAAIAQCVLMLVLLSSCAAEVGSERWCKQLKKQLDEGLTIDGSKQYAQHCLFK